MPSGPGDLVAPDNVMELVVGLLDKSLITRLPMEGGEPRYRLLDSTRYYALEKLVEAGETPALQRAHARHMVTVFGTARCRYPDTDTMVWRSAIEPEIENLQAALAWAFGEDGDDATAIALAARLQNITNETLIDRRMARSLTRAAVSKLTPDTPRDDAARLLFSLSFDTSSNISAQVAAGERALALFEDLGDTQMTGMALVRLATCHALSGNGVAAQSYAERVRALLPSIPTNLNKAMILVELGAVAGIAGRDAADLETADRDYAAALAIYEQFSNEAGALVVSANVAEIRARRGDYAGAIDLAMRTKAVNFRRRDWFRLCINLTNLTSYAVLAQDHSTATDAARAALPLIGDLQDGQSGSAFADGLALLAARNGALETAARLAGYAEQFYVANQQVREDIEQRVWEATMALLEAADAHGALPAATRVALMQDGAALTLDAALALGSKLLAERN